MSQPDCIIPEIFVHDGPGALEFYKRAFDAVEVSRMMTPDGKKLMHAEFTLAGHPHLLSLGSVRWASSEAMGVEMRAIELVVFDLAGTTVCDDGQVPDAFTAALAEYGVTIGPEAIRGLRGASKREAILALLPAGSARAEQAERAYASFRDHLARQYAGTARAVGGAVDVFAWLRGRGIRVALNTGFDRDTTQMLLAALGWAAGTVDAIVCGDEVPQGRPAPYMIFRCMEATGSVSVGHVANVGDTALDLRAGHNAGVRFNIGVLSGAHGQDMLAAEPHTHLLASVADLPALLADT